MILACRYVHTWGTKIFQHVLKNRNGSILLLVLKLDGIATQRLAHKIKATAVAAKYAGTYTSYRTNVLSRNPTCEADARGDGGFCFPVKEHKLPLSCAPPRRRRIRLDIPAGVHLAHYKVNGEKKPTGECVCIVSHAFF